MGKLIGGAAEGFIVLQNTPASIAWMKQAMLSGEIFRHRKRWTFQRIVQRREITMIYLIEIH